MSFINALQWLHWDAVCPYPALPQVDLTAVLVISYFTVQRFGRRQIILFGCFVQVSAMLIFTVLGSRVLFWRLVDSGLISLSASGPFDNTSDSLGPNSDVVLV